MKEEKNPLNNIYKYLPERIIKSINQNKKHLKNISEIRLRASRASSITVFNENILLLDEKQKPIKVSSEELDDIFFRICQMSVYKYDNEIKNGYITLNGGSRVGICASAVNTSGEISTIKDISSLNFRISKTIINASKEVFESIYQDDKIYSTLIVSEPCGGKTTMLTDIANNLSKNGIRSVVVDERGEIASCYMGVPQKDVGQFCDVLDGYSKGDGMMIALRCLSPQAIICDEIGSKSDVDAMMEAMNAGVPVIATAHASNENELLSRPQIEFLINSGAIVKIIILKGQASPGKIKKVIKVNKNENAWDFADMC